MTQFLTVSASGELMSMRPVRPPSMLFTFTACSEVLFFATPNSRRGVSRYRVRVRFISMPQKEKPGCARTLRLQISYMAHKPYDDDSEKHCLGFTTKICKKIKGLFDADTWNDCKEMMPFCFDGTKWTANVHLVWKASYVNSTELAD